jgi:hypothetical protein
LRGRLTYANVAATLALVLAMSGGALAANHYLINSTKQINPKVLKKLRGARGARGAIGPNGLIGPQGVQGALGQRGAKGDKGDAGFSALSLLPKGATENGDFAFSEPVASGFLESALTFSIPLEASIAQSQVEVVPIATPGPNCLAPGSAKRGWLCVYVSSSKNLKLPPTIFNPEAKAPSEGSSGRFGAGFVWEVEKAGESADAAGSFSVTAP